MRRKSQEDLAARIRLGQRPAQRQSAARRKGRTTSELPSDEVRDRVSNVLPDPRPFERAYAKYQAGENLSTQDKIDLGIETGFAGLAAIPVVGALAQKGKPMIKGLAKKFLGEASEKLTKGEKRVPTGTSNVKTKKPESVPASKVDKSGTGGGRGAFSATGRPKGAAAASQKKKMLKDAEKGAEKIKDTANQRKIAKDIKAKRGGAGKPPAVTNKPPAVTPPKSQVPAKRKPTTPAKPTGQRGFNLGSTKPKSKRNILGPLAGAGLAAGTAAYLSQSEKDAKPAKSRQAPVNKEPTVNKMSDYELADDTNIRSPRKAAPKPASKPAPEKDDGYRFYGKKGTGLGDFSRKYGIKYATQEQFEKDFGYDGEQMGGRPGKSKMKTQGLNRSKRTGFSGRGTGAALRGF